MEAATPPVPVVPPPLPPSVVASAISFSNSRAVTISMLVAGCALLALLLSNAVAAFLMPFVLCGAGFLAVTLYNRRSALPPTTVDGARLGWMTGLWLFLIFAVICAIVSVAMGNPALREQMRQIWVAKAPEAAKMLDNPHEFLMSLLVNLITFFFLLTLLPGLGGMIGAKLLTRRRHSS